MAGEIHLNWNIIDNLFACILDTTGKVWYVVGQVFETWGTSGRDAADYDIPMSKFTGALHLGDWDTNISNGVYYINIFVRAGGTPVDGDVGDTVGNWKVSVKGNVLTRLDQPTEAEMNARTIPAANYFDPAADTVANVTLVATTTTNSDMRGTDGANVVVPDVAGTAAALHVTTDNLIGAGFTQTLIDIADLPTVAEFEARTLLAADYFDPAADGVSITDIDTATLAKFVTVDTGELVAVAGSVAELAKADSIGGGAIAYPYAITDEPAGTPLGDVYVWVTTDLAGLNTVQTGRTDDFGKVTFYLNAGTYYMWRKKTNFDFPNPDTEVVSAAA